MLLKIKQWKVGVERLEWFQVTTIRLGVVHHKLHAHTGLEITASIKMWQTEAIAKQY